MTTVTREITARAVVEDAGKEDVLRSAGTCGNENSDSRRDDRLGDVFQRLPLKETDRRQPSAVPPAAAMAG